MILRILQQDCKLQRLENHLNRLETFDHRGLGCPCVSVRVLQTLGLPPARVWSIRGQIARAMTYALQLTARTPARFCQSRSLRCRQPVRVRSRASSNGPESPPPRAPASNPLQQVKTGLSQLTEVCSGLTVPPTAYRACIRSFS